MIPEVLQIYATDGFLVYIYFNDGTVRLFDANPVIEKGNVFEPLKDIDTFKSKATVLNGTLAWDLKGNRSTEDCIDLDTCVLYETSSQVSDPLSKLDNN